MKTHVKKQIIAIVERPVVDRLTRFLDRAQVTGYTILPALAGRGHGGAWDREGLVGDAGQMVQLVCILDASRLDAVLDGVFSLISAQSGIVSVQEVEVVRPDHF